MKSLRGCMYLPEKSVLASNPVVDGHGELHSKMRTLKMDKIFHEVKQLHHRISRQMVCSQVAAMSSQFLSAQQRWPVSVREGQEVKSAHGNLFRTSLKKPSRVRQ